MKFNLYSILKLGKNMKIIIKKNRTAETMVQMVEVVNIDPTFTLT